MSALRSLLFAIVFYPATVFFVLAAVPANWFGPEALRSVPNAWAHFHRWCARWILGIRTRVEGNVPDGPALVACKHQSMYETIDMVVILRNPAVVMKKELADIPMWGPLAQRYGMIPVDRSGGASALRRMLKAAEAIVADRRPIVIFPEGTRVAPGERPELQPGFGGLYRALGLPVVPVALDSGQVWPRRRFIKRPGVINMRFGEPIPPGLPRKEVEARVHAAINALDDQAP